MWFPLTFISCFALAGFLIYTGMRSERGNPLFQRKAKPVPIPPERNPGHPYR